MNEPYKNEQMFIIKNIENLSMFYDFIFFPKKQIFYI